MSTNILLAPAPVFRAFSSTGQPLAGGKLYTYAAGTTTPLATYTDSTGGTPNANPVVLDSTGTANIWLTRAAYKFVLTDSNGVTQWTVDQINAQPPKVIDVADYGAIGNGTTDDSAAFTSAASAAGAWGTVLVKRPSVSYKLNSNVTGPCFWALMGSATISGTGTLGGITVQQISGGAFNIGNVYISSSGLLGVNTSAPVEQIDVAGNMNFPYVGGNPAGKIVWNGSGSGIGDCTMDYGVTTLDTWTLNPTVSSSGVTLTYSDSTLRMGTAVQSSATKAVTVTPTYVSIGSNPATVAGLLLSTSSFGANQITQQAVTSPYNDFSWVQFDSGGSTTSGTYRLIWNYLAGSFNSGGTPRDVISIYNHSTMYLGGDFNVNSTTAVGMAIITVGNSGTATPLTFTDRAPGASSATLANMVRGSTTVGSISTTNAATAYNTSSDYRLKENLKPIQGAVDTVNAVPMYTGNFKVAPDIKVEFCLAHELQAALPYAVHGEKDAKEFQQVDYSKLVPVLWAAVQELSQQLQTLRKELGHGR